MKKVKQVKLSLQDLLQKGNIRLKEKDSKTIKGGQSDDTRRFEAWQVVPEGD